MFQQERARVDRNDQVFSMVVFLPKEGRNACSRMVETLKERMRVYDSIGQLDGRRIALLLPETDADGAWTFADDAMSRLAEEGLAYDCEVYCYPLDWADHDGRRESRRERRRLKRTGSDDSSGEGDRGRGDDSTGTRESTGTDGPMGGERGPRLRMVTDGVDSNRADSNRAGTTLLAPTLERVRRPVDQRPVHDLAPIFVQPLPRTRRVIDILVAGSALVLMAPLCALVAILIKLDSPGPVFFVQKRAGLGGRPFNFFKFRSMYVDAEKRRKEVLALNQHKSGPIFKLKDDPRITRVGRWLRRTSLDELPQLYNVFRGDMTLIGPRPPRLDEVAKYEAWQRRRLEVTGGLTCIWQVSGRSEIGFEEWVRMDIQYQDRRSLLFDLKLLFKTVGAVLSGRGAY